MIKLVSICIPMKKGLLCILMLSCCVCLGGQIRSTPSPDGYESRLREYIDTITVFSTHEHFLDPDLLKTVQFLDFALLFLENGYNDLVSAGMNDSLFNTIFSVTLTSAEKWSIMEPYWSKAFNTANSRIMMRAIEDIYGYSELNAETATSITGMMRRSYGTEWFERILHEKCNIDYIIIDGDRLTNKSSFIKYSERFDPWISVRSKKVIDSLAIMQVEPIYTLEGFVKSMTAAFTYLLKEGMIAVKIDLAYERSIRFDKTDMEQARKVFRSLVNGNEDTKLSHEAVKPLQDYMVYHLLELAGKNNIPVAIHTGFQAGNGNKLTNSEPTLLTNLFQDFPEVKFVIFHGAYPFGGELSALAKNFSNVYIDMNWTYAISPSYAGNYLSEWLETVPLNKIMAFGGDQRMVEITYGSLVFARQVVADVLIEKVRSGYFTEPEAKTAARMILHDNGMNFYNIISP